MTDRPRGRLDADALSDLLASAPAGPAPHPAAAAGVPAAEADSFAALVRRRPAGPAPSAAVALVLAILLGGVGAHWLYLRRWGLAAGRFLLNVAAGVLFAAGTAYTSAYPDVYHDTTGPFLHFGGGVLWVASAVWWLVDVIGIARRHAYDADGRLVV